MKIKCTLKKIPYDDIYEKLVKKLRGKETVLDFLEKVLYEPSNDSLDTFLCNFFDMLDGTETAVKEIYGFIHDVIYRETKVNIWIRRIEVKKKMKGITIRVELIDPSSEDFSKFNLYLEKKRIELNFIKRGYFKFMSFPSKIYPIKKMLISKILKAIDSDIDFEVLDFKYTFDT